MTDQTKHECAPENAAKMREWIATRGGVAIWRSINLSNAGASWSSPALTEGVPTKKPNWQSENVPSRVITDASEIEVVTRKEVKRFRVAIRASGAFGATFKLTDTASARVRRECDKLGSDSAYEFDYETQECILTMPGERVSLADWIEPAAVQGATP